MDSPGPEISVGIDLGGTTVKAGRVNRDGAIFDSQSRSTPTSAEGFANCLRDWLVSVHREGEPVGIGCRGVIEPGSTRVLRSPGDLSYLEGHSLRGLLGLSETTSVFADNDARAALLGEVLWGEAKGKRNAVLLTLGTGVGGTAMVDGHVLRGFSGAAGHLGHVSVEPGGPLCICGNIGCLETRFSSRAIEGEMFAHLHRKLPSSLLSSQYAAEPPSTESVFAAAANADPGAAHVVADALRYLTSALVSFAHSFDPEIIVLSGQITYSSARWLSALQEEVNRRTRFIIGREVPIVPAASLALGGVRGAAALAYWETAALHDGGQGGS